MMYNTKTIMKSAVAVVSSVAITALACGGHGGCSGHHGAHSDDIVTAEATASHILVKTIEEAESIKAQFEGLESCDVKAKFAELAKEHSQCPSKENGGSLGNFEKGQMVPEFEEVIFDKENAIDTVHGPVETQFGQHLILIENRLNGDGSKDGKVMEVKKASASHILVDEEAKCLELKEQIEAAENQLEEFAKLAAENSKCPSGAQAGGNLGNFRQGQMVAEFDSVIFGAEYALNKVHGPVQTQFGSHLIIITERSGMEEEEEVVEAKKEEEEEVTKEEVASTEEVTKEEIKKEESTTESTDVPSDSEEPSVSLESSEEAVVEEEKSSVVEEEKSCETNAEL